MDGSDPIRAITGNAASELERITPNGRATKLLPLIPSEWELLRTCVNIRFRFNYSKSASLP